MASEIWKEFGPFERSWTLPVCPRSLGWCCPIWLVWSQFWSASSSFQEVRFRRLKLDGEWVHSKKTFRCQTFRVPSWWRRRRSSSSYAKRPSIPGELFPPPVSSSYLVPVSALRRAQVKKSPYLNARIKEDIKAVLFQFSNLVPWTWKMDQLGAPMNTKWNFQNLLRSSRACPKSGWRQRTWDGASLREPLETNYVLFPYLTFSLPLPLHGITSARIFSTYFLAKLLTDA